MEKHISFSKINSAHLLLQRTPVVLLFYNIEYENCREKRTYINVKRSVAVGIRVRYLKLVRRTANIQWEFSFAINILPTMDFALFFCCSFSKHKLYCRRWNERWQGYCRQNLATVVAIVSDNHYARFCSISW